MAHQININNRSTATVKATRTTDNLASIANLDARTAETELKALLTSLRNTDGTSKEGHLRLLHTGHRNKAYMKFRAVGGFKGFFSGNSKQNGVKGLAKLIAAATKNSSEEVSDLLKDGRLQAGEITCDSAREVIENTLNSVKAQSAAIKAESPGLGYVLAKASGLNDDSAFKIMLETCKKTDAGFDVESQDKLQGLFKDRENSVARGGNEFYRKWFINPDSTADPKDMQRKQVAFALKGACQDENLLELLQSHKDQIETEIKGVTQLGTGQRSMTDKSSGFAGAIVKPARELMANDGWTILKKPFGAIEESLWKNTNALMEIGGNHPSLKDALKDDGQLMKELRSSLKVSRNNEEEKKAISHAKQIVNKVFVLSKNRHLNIPDPRTEQFFNRELRPYLEKLTNASAKPLTQLQQQAEAQIIRDWVGKKF